MHANFMNTVIDKSSGVLTSGYSLTGTSNFSDRETVGPYGSAKRSGSMLVLR